MTRKHTGGDHEHHLLGHDRPIIRPQECRHYGCADPEGLRNEIDSGQGAESQTADQFGTELRVTPLTSRRPARASAIGVTR